MPEHRPDRDAELRALFEDTVSDVDPTPALDRIHSRTRSRTKVTSMNEKRPWIFGIIGAVAATAATLVGVTVLTDREDASGASDPASSPSSPPTPGSTPSASGSGQPGDEPTDEPSEDVGDPVRPRQITVPVYYLGTSERGTFLFREFHRASTATKNDLLAALEEALNSAPLDSDYHSPWTDLGVSVVSTFQGGEIAIDLGGDPALRQRPAGMTGRQAELAVQQVVYTATAAVQSSLPVSLTLNGSPTRTLLGVNVGEPLARADQMQTLNPVWVISPQQGETVDGTFTVEGQGAFFEANVSWQLASSAGEVVQEGYATAEECCKLSPYSFEVTDVDPGEYTVRVYAADESGGESGMPEPEDTKRITVR